MTITFQYVKIAESEALSKSTTDQLQKLAEKYSFLIRAQVFFKLENTSDPKNSICEIELSAPGPRIFASSIDVHFEPAMKETISDLNKQLRKRKEAMKTH
jgi:putative sigma-54 modulation protein